MDYQLEAHNTMTFKQHMAGLQGVRVATVYPEFTSRKIIVTEWIEVGLLWAQQRLVVLLRVLATACNCVGTTMMICLARMPPPASG
jgi:hypothetical protein